MQISQRIGEWPTPGGRADGNRKQRGSRALTAISVRHHASRHTENERHTMNPGIVGGIVGSLLGVAGGLIGTYFSIKNTNGLRERAFMIRSAVVCWIGVGLFLAAMFFVPQARLWIWIPYCILLPLGIRYGNKKQMAIRREERTDA